jgi:hypothetical protein
MKNGDLTQASNIILHKQSLLQQIHSAQKILTLSFFQSTGAFVIRPLFKKFWKLANFFLEYSKHGSSVDNNVNIFHLGIFACLRWHFLFILNVYGIRGVSEDWFRFHLTNRRHKVEVKSPDTIIFFLWLGYIETWISPSNNSKAYIFIIYINDLPLRINSMSEPI